MIFLLRKHMVCKKMEFFYDFRLLLNYSSAEGSFVYSSLAG